jgi:hypothetical protein
MRRNVLLVVGLVSALVTLAGPASAVADPEGSFGVVDGRTGIWYLYDDATTETTSFYFGNPGDVPFVGDWDCDGVDTPGLYRQSDGFVYLRNTNTQGNADVRFFFGNPGDIPLAGDFDGDGCDTVSIYRPSQGRVFVINELGSDDGGLGAAEFDYYFGNPGDKPFVGDFDADGVDTVGLHRESTGLVYFRNSHTQGIADESFIYGNPDDKIIAGHWSSGQSVDTVGIYRPAFGEFFLRHSNTPGYADQSFEYGNYAMVPVAGNFGVLPGGSEPPPRTPPALTIITDSVVLGAERYFPDAFPGATIDMLGWPALMLHQVEDRVLPAGRWVNPHTVIAIGYNSLWEKDRLNYDKWAAKFDREANAVLDLVRSRGAKSIVWVTLREASPEAIITAQQIDQNRRFGFYMYYVNERLRILDEANDDLVLADWAAVSKGPGNTYDLIHLNPTGARLMVKTIAGAYGM